MTTSTRTPRTGLALGALALSAACTGAVLSLAPGALAQVARAPQAAADGPTCFGQPATIVGEGYLVGTHGPDVIVATGTAEVHSGSGDDLICGAALAYAGPGDDRIRSIGTGSEIVGAGGDDLIIQSDAGSYAEIYGGPGADTIRTGYGVQWVNAGKGDDVVQTGRGNDHADGRAGDDVIDGGLGEDSVGGRAGDDVLDGGRGDDELEGGAGRDRLVGFFGDDTLGGGPRADDLDGGPGRDTGNGGRGSDFCHRFEVITSCEGSA